MFFFSSSSSTHTTVNNKNTMLRQTKNKHHVVKMVQINGSKIFVPENHRLESSRVEMKLLFKENEI